MTVRAWTSLLVVTFLLANVSLVAQSPKPKPDTKKESYSVIDLGGEDQRVVPKAGVTELKKRMAEEFKTATKEWQAAKVAAKKAKEKFSTPKPKATKIKVLKAGFKTRAAAEEYLAKRKSKGKSKN